MPYGDGLHAGCGDLSERSAVRGISRSWTYLTLSSLLEPSLVCPLVQYVPSTSLEQNYGSPAMCSKRNCNYLCLVPAKLDGSRKHHAWMERRLFKCPDTPRSAPKLSAIAWESVFHSRSASPRQTLTFPIHSLLSIIPKLGKLR